MVAVEDLSPAQVEEIKDSFTLFDRDEDGFITVDELGDCMRAIGMNPTFKELKEIIKSVDVNENGKIEQSEFIELMAKHMKSAEEIEDETLAAFKVFDRDGNGFISADELRITLTTLGDTLSDAEVDRMMAQADVNHDGRISYKEFAKMMLGGK